MSWFTKAISALSTVTTVTTGDFDKCYEIVKEFEGGYVNDPKDSGGETKYGISKKAYPDVDIKNLTEEEAKKIYYKDYWLASKANKMRFPMNLIVFDTAVNMGVSRGTKYYMQTGDAPLKYLDIRDARYLKLATLYPKNKKFLRGWLRRTNKLRSYVIAKGLSN